MSAVSQPRARSSFCLCALIPVLFLSCIGTSSKITFNDDGSGTLVQEYRVSLELEHLGALDGNEAQPAVPAIRSDLEKTVARIPGLSLVSYKTSEDGKDRIHRAEIAFASPEALSALFAANEQLLTVDFPGKRILVTLPGSEETENDEMFREMVTEEFSGYMFDISFSLPGTARYTWLDQDGNPLPDPAAIPGTCSLSDKTIDYSVSMADIVYLDNSRSLEISW